MTGTLGGRMRIHGVTPHFPLKLKDYEIGGLSKALGMLRMREDTEVHVDLTFAPR